MPGPRTTGTPKGTVRNPTVRVVDDRPKMPKVDSGDAFEGLVRQMFAPKVKQWAKDNLRDKLTKDVIGNVIDNLTAQWVSAIENVVDSATDSYLSTTEEEGEIECPGCECVFEIPEDDKGELVAPGTLVQCPECRLKFALPEDEDEVVETEPA